ncbi:flagellar FlbD family protein [Nocardioides rubriscoriae]|uniref:flagellar FlbD family protein n=1 Tax=Nocardioides rubriscoriae TaxID=642762 RepID=UPI0011DF4CE5|nr:flagellar FlbD family protein [Nocardioides rubriscoriae]
MILLTRLSGSMFALNSDLIERVDSTPDTVITVVGGTKYVVAESLAEIVSTVRAHRAEILALSDAFAATIAQEPMSSAPARRPVLSVIRQQMSGEPASAGAAPGETP